VTPKVAYVAQLPARCSSVLAAMTNTPATTSVLMIAACRSGCVAMIMAGAAGVVLLIAAALVVLYYRRGASYVRITVDVTD
jgi:hypothetical protein